MENSLDFIGYLKEYCDEKHIYLIAGPKDYQNAIIDKHIYAAYDLILLADLTFSPSFEEFGVTTYTGTIGLGQKREEMTVSSLDETFQQKYDRRLLKLSETLVTIFRDMECTNDIEIQSFTGSYALNKFDLNADFVVANITIKVAD